MAALTLTTAPVAEPQRGVRPASLWRRLTGSRPGPALPEEVLAWLGWDAWVVTAAPGGPHPAPPRRPVGPRAPLNPREGEPRP